MYETSCQSRFDARYWMLGAGALGRPRGMVWGGMSYLQSTLREAGAWVHGPGRAPGKPSLAGACWAQTEDPSGCGAASPSQGRWDPNSLRPALSLGGQATAGECKTQSCLFSSPANPLLFIPTIGPGAGALGVDLPRHTEPLKAFFPAPGPVRRALSGKDFQCCF